jgi:protein subunit release factor A
MLPVFLQDRVTDHRVSVTVPGVDRVMSGENLDVVVDALIDSDEKEKLDIFLESLEKKGGR